MSAPRSSMGRELAIAAGVALVGVGVVAAVLGVAWLLGT